jgi:hypothetical protein
LTIVPLVPVIVIEESPKATALVAVSVSVEVFPVVLLGLKLAVTPEGSPVTLIAIEPLNPELRASVTSMALLAPGTSTCGLGLATTAKLPVGCTVTVTKRLRTNTPSTAVIWTLKLPSGVPVLVVTVIVEEPAVVLLGLNPILTPLGGVDALSVTGVESPPENTSDTVNCTAPPGATVCNPGLTLISRSGPESRRISAWSGELLPHKLVVEVPMFVHPVGIGLLGKHTKCVAPIGSPITLRRSSSFWGGPIQSPVTPVISVITHPLGRALPSLHANKLAPDTNVLICSIVFTLLGLFGQFEKLVSVLMCIVTHPAGLVVPVQTSCCCWAKLLAFNTHIRTAMNSILPCNTINLPA